MNDQEIPLRVSPSLFVFYFYHWSNALEGNPAMAIQAGAYWLDHAWSGLFDVYSRFTEDRPTGVFYYGSP